MFPCGETISRGRVNERNQYSDGNPVGQANGNPILDSLNYLDEFEDGEVTKLAAKIISESIYAMCDPEGEIVLIFDCIVDFKHDRNDMTLTD